MRYRTSCAIAAAWLAILVLLTGCVSNFQFEIPEHHPARATAPPAGPLPVPSPFDVTPPEEPAKDGGGTMQNEHGGHAKPATEHDKREKRDKEDR